MKLVLLAFLLGKNPLSSRKTLTANMASNLETEYDILFLDGYTLSKTIESGQVSSLHLMEATLRRIHRINPSLLAIINLAPDDILLERARKADQTPRQGWLHGIPIAIKDLSNAAGFPTTLGGSPLVNSNAEIASTSDLYCQRLENAGAIIIGKTNTPEHGLGSHTFNSMWGTTVNPYCLSESAGGSSGGAAVAVATRMLSIADGSDMMGSLRNPAGWNNIYSLRPTAGIIMEGDDVECNPLPYPISTVGPMARTPRDLKLMLETMSNCKLDSSVSRQAMEGTKIAWLGDWCGSYPMERGILELCRHALESFQGKGVSVIDLEERPLFDARKLWNSWTTLRSKIISSTAIDEYGREVFFGPDPKVKKEFVWEVQRGDKLSDKQVADASTIANEWSNCVMEVFNTYDALALPTAQVWPFDATIDWPKSIGTTQMQTYHQWMQVVVPATLGGLPAVTIPAGFGDEGLPMGIQLIGARGSDGKLLALAQAYHEVIDWPSKRLPSLT